MYLSYIPKDTITVDKLIESLTKLRDKHNCGNLPVALSHWVDDDMVETHKSGVITRVDTTDGPSVLHVGSHTMECIMLDFDMFTDSHY